MLLVREPRAVRPGRPSANRRAWGRLAHRIAHNPRLWLGIAVLVPTIMWYIVLVLGPILEAFWFSVFHVDIANMSSWFDIFATSQFVGLVRFQHLFDPMYNPEF